MAKKAGERPASESMEPTPMPVADVSRPRVMMTTIGNPDAFQLLSQDATQTVKVLPIQGVGCLVAVLTDRGVGVTFVPSTKLIDDINGGKQLVLR